MGRRVRKSDETVKRFRIPASTGVKLGAKPCDFVLALVAADAV